MTNPIEQLDMFPPTENERMAQEIKILKDGLDHLRRSFFSRHVDLCSTVSALQKEVEILKEKIKG